MKPAESSSTEAAKAEAAAWWAKYRRVDAEITAALERRRAARARNARARARTFGDVCEMTEGRAKFARDRGISLAEADLLLAGRRLPAPFCPVPPGLAFDAASALRRAATLRLDRIRHRLMRPLYYERERERRRELAAERRKVSRRTTTRPCPTKEDVLDAWIAAKGSPAALLRFGSMLEDLECHVDSSLLRDGSGAIVGRRAGIKGWLAENLPALLPKYKTLMAYKAAARRMRQVAGLSDPTPLSDALPPEGAKTHGGVCPAADVAILRARAVCLEVLEQVGSGERRTTALRRRLDELTSPDSVEDANMLREWKERYEYEITVRTKDRWARRLGKRLGKWAG